MGFKLKDLQMARKESSIRSETVGRKEMHRTGYFTPIFRAAPLSSFSLGSGTGLLGIVAASVCFFV